jgi:hypothetical protein
MGSNFHPAFFAQTASSSDRSGCKELNSSHFKAYVKPIGLLRLYHDTVFDLDDASGISGCIECRAVQRLGRDRPGETDDSVFHAHIDVSKIQFGAAVEGGYNIFRDGFVQDPIRWATAILLTISRTPATVAARSSAMTFCQNDVTVPESSTAPSTTEISILLGSTSGLQRRMSLI